MTNYEETGGEDYEVGFGKPPRHTRFQKGKSGNPKGRPKGTNNFRTDLMDTLRMSTKINSDGKSTKVSTQKAALLRLREKALNGDVKALDRLLQLSATHNDEDAVEHQARALSATDNDIVEEYKKQLAAEARADSSTKADEEDELPDRATPEDDDEDIDAVWDRAMRLDGDNEEEEDAWLN